MTRGSCSNVNFSPKGSCQPQGRSPQGRNPPDGRTPGTDPSRRSDPRDGPLQTVGPQGRTPPDGRTPGVTEPSEGCNLHGFSHLLRVRPRNFGGWPPLKAPEGWAPGCPNPCKGRNRFCQGSPPSTSLRSSRWLSCRCRPNGGSARWLPDPLCSFCLFDSPCRCDAPTHSRRKQHQDLRLPQLQDVQKRSVLDAVDMVEPLSES